MVELTVMQNHKRRNYLINKPLQLKYVVMVLVLVGVYSLFTCYTVSIALKSSQKVVENLPDVSADDLNNIERQNSNIFMTMVLLLVVNAGVVGVLWLMAMHRIAGPIYRLRRSIEQFKSGIMPPPIHLRRGDEFMELINEFNVLMEYVQSGIKLDLEHLDRMVKSADSLNSAISKNESMDTAIREQMKNVLTELHTFRENKTAMLNDTKTETAS